MTRDDDPGGAAGAPSAPAAPPYARFPAQAWHTVADGRGRTAKAQGPLQMRRVFGQVIAAAAVVLLGVAIVGLFASRKVAEQQSVHDAAQVTDLLADSVVQPALEDGLLTNSPAAVARLDAAVRTSVLGPRIVRVKVWDPSGKVLYSDEPRVVGETFTLGEEERSVLVAPTTHAEISDLSRPENRFEQGQTRLLEVYRPVWTPSGRPLLFETYLPYDSVTDRTGELWRGFAGITLTSLMLMVALMLPIIWRLLDRVNAAQEQRVALLEHAVDASADERRRIAGTLHDGVVQELVATSYALSGAEERARQARRAGSEGIDADAVASIIGTAAATVRGAIGGLRSLLVDIYPPSLQASGLPAALADLAGSVRTRDIDVQLHLPDASTSPTAQMARLDEDRERLIYRVTQESLRNTAAHAAAQHVIITLEETKEAVVLSVYDDGVGFDVAGAFARPAEGHYGLQIMSDLATASGALLQVASGPGIGTCWRLTVPS